MVDQKVLIGIPTAEYARRADFYDYLNGLEKPNPVGIMSVHGQSPARNRNIIIKRALEDNFTHIFFLDDDLVFKSDLLMNLLKHDLDVVTGLYLFRSYPHLPIIFDITDEKGNAGAHYLDDNEKGLIKVRSCGLGCVLIKTDVFRKMDALGLSTDHHGVKDKWVTLGSLESDHWCDDTDLFTRVIKAGFDIWCDLSQPVGHMASVTVWPHTIDGKWYVTYDTISDKGRVSFPAQKLSEAEKKLREEAIRKGELIGV